MLYNMFKDELSNEAELLAWWHMPIIPALWRLRHEDCHELKASLGHSEFKASLNYIARPCLKKGGEAKFTQQKT